MKRSMMTTADVQRHRIGAAITLLTHRSAWFSGSRQLVFDWRPHSPPLGRLIGVSITRPYDAS
jgi:hypothetical protein